LRIAVVYNIPIACNRSSADFIISSPLIDVPYEPRLKNYSDYLKRISPPEQPLPPEAERMHGHTLLHPSW